MVLTLIDGLTKGRIDEEVKYEFDNNSELYKDKENSKAEELPKAKWDVTKKEIEFKTEINTSESDELSRRMFSIYETVEEMENLLHTTRKEFNDIIDRQILFHQLKKITHKLWKEKFLNDKPFLMIVSDLEDSLFFTKSEKLTLEQINMLIEVVNILKKINKLALNDVEESGKLLRKANFITSPT